MSSFVKSGKVTVSQLTRSVSVVMLGWVYAAASSVEVSVAASGSLCFAWVAETYLRRWRLGLSARLLFVAAAAR